MLGVLLALSTVPVTETPPVDVMSVALGADGSQRMTVPVKVHGSEAFPFVVDTGAERTVISRQLADRLNLEDGQRAT